ncbi:MAG: hypothetical protein ACTHJ7_07585 [Candidatus Nitrosocosmicus sp.]
MKLNNNDKFLKLNAIQSTILIAFKIVFSNPVYIVISISVFVVFWIIFNTFDQLLFFSPILSFYLPDDAVNGFIITNITSFLMGILVAMNVYVINNSILRFDKSMLIGSFVGIASSACASCSSIGFLLISTLGGFGIIATDFLTNYQTSFRIISISILIWALYSVLNRITKSCRINSLSDKMKR